MLVLECNNILKSFNNGNSKFKISIKKLEIGERCALGLIGPNGSGKSTLVKLILDLLKAECGNIKIMGINNFIANSRKYIGYLPEDFSLPTNYSFEEISFYFGLMKGISSKNVKQEIKKLSKVLNIEKFLKIKTQAFSKGMAQSLGILQAVMGNNKLLILDEPFNGLDPVQREEAINLLIHLRQNENVSILITSHILVDIDRICDDIALIREGKIRERMTKNDIFQKYGSTKKFYFSYFK